MLTAGLLGATVLVLALTAGAQPANPVVNAAVSATPSGAPLAPSFVGVSLEYSALHLYTGRDPRAVNPVLVQLLRNLVPGRQTPVLRIGGDSADATWWPERGVIPPGGVSYALNNGWLRTTSALARVLGARLIMGVNLAGGRPGLAAAEGRALLRGIGRRYIQAIEIGNEPDVYGVFVWYRDRRGRVFFARGRGYNLSRFIRQFSQWRAALPSVPVTGPAFAELNWLSGLPRFIKAEPGLKLLTIHRYPLHGCLTDPSAPGYPSTANMLSDQASSGVAHEVAPYVGVAHRSKLAFRLDEMNSAAVASCIGRQGASGTFASALWVLDTLFNLANVGVDGVNLHSLPGAAYELWTFQQTSSGWEAFVHPEYYGMLMFTQAFPPGARLLPVNVKPGGPLKVWATRSSDFKTRVVLINKDPNNTYQVQVRVPGLTSQAQLERLQAPSASSTDGVTLGGQSYGDETTTGTFPGPPQTEPVAPVLGTYTITMPAASAALLTQ